MTTTFGDRQSFAIEAMVEPTLTPPSSVWGRMCVWCAGRVLGDIHDPHCALYPAYASFAWLLGNVHDLWEMPLDGLDDLALWNHLDGALYGYHGDVPWATDPRSDFQVSVDWQRWNKFNFLTNWGESFDNEKAFVLRPPGGPIRILYRADNPFRPIRADVPQSTFVEAAYGLVSWFDAESKRLAE